MHLPLQIPLHIPPFCLYIHAILSLSNNLLPQLPRPTNLSPKSTNMLLDYLHVALVALLPLASSVYGLPVKNLPTASFTSHPIGYTKNYVHIPASLNETAPSLHTLSRDYTNLTALGAFGPASNVEKRRDGDSINPSKVVGKLRWSNGASCSASLVGPRHILTARHCVPTSEGITVIFEPDYDNGDSSFGRASVERAYTVDRAVGVCRTKHDFAVMVLSERIGDEVGWLGVVLPDPTRFNQAIFSTRGYPETSDHAETPFSQHSITLPDPWAVTDDFQFNCDATGPIVSCGLRLGCSISGFCVLTLPFVLSTAIMRCI